MLFTCQKCTWHRNLATKSFPRFPGMVLELKGGYKPDPMRSLMRPPWLQPRSQVTTIPQVPRHCVCRIVLYWHHIPAVWHEETCSHSLPADIQKITSVSDPSYIVPNRLALLMLKVYLCITHPPMSPSIVLFVHQVSLGFFFPAKKESQLPSEM